METSDLIREHEDKIHKYKRSKGNRSYKLYVANSKAIPLIDINCALPVMPNPWSSSDQGEGWIWGDFIIHFLKDPKEMMNQSPQGEPIAIKYLYSMVVFYRPERNPHYPSKAPILAVNLEQAVESLPLSKGNNPLFLGMFDQGGLRHINHGEYQGSTEAEVVKSHLFKMICEQLGLTDLPRQIGTLKETIYFFNSSLEEALDRRASNKGGPPNERVQDAASFDNEMVAIIRKAEFPPIADIFTYPSMAAPFSSIDDGEVWVWDGYFCVLQKKPKTVYEVFKSSFPSDFPPGRMAYHYAMSVLHISTSPESSVPILSIGIEQLISPDYKGMIFLGMFKHNSRCNLGEYCYDESTSVDQVRSKFMELVKNKLKLSGEPELKGTIPDIFPDVHAFINNSH